MKRSRMWMICALLAWALYLAVSQPWRGDAFARTSAQVGLLYPQLQVQTEQIRRVEVRDGTHQATLVMAPNGQWLVEEKEHPLQAQRLMQLVENLTRLETLDVVSMNPDKHEVFGVAEGQGTRVTLLDEDGRILADWIAGSLRKQEIDGGQKPVLEFYMRDARSPAVYLSGQAIHPPADPRTWCDTDFLYGIDADRIEWVERSDFDGGQSWRIERSGAPIETEDGMLGQWRMTSPETAPVTSYAGDSMAYSLSSLKAADVVGKLLEDGSEDLRYGFPMDRFRVGIGGQVFEFELGKVAKPGHRYLRVTHLPYLYLLADFEVGQLRQPVLDMLEQDSEAGD